MEAHSAPSCLPTLLRLWVTSKIEEFIAPSLKPPGCQPADVWFPPYCSLTAKSCVRSTGVAPSPHDERKS